MHDVRVGEVFFIECDDASFGGEVGLEIGVGGGEGMRASRTSMTRSASLRRWRMARVAAAMWPGNQVMAPPPALNAMSPKPNPFFSNSFSPDIAISSLSVTPSHFQSPEISDFITPSNGPTGFQLNPSPVRKGGEKVK